jgi:hypothetical protein
MHMNTSKNANSKSNNEPFLASLTPEKIRMLAHQALNESLQSCYESKLLHITEEESVEAGGKKGGRKKSVKTKAGNRIVPLHPFLIDPDGPVNLLAYVEEMKSEGRSRLFPTLTENSRGNVSDAATKWFTRYPQWG